MKPVDSFSIEINHYCQGFGIHPASVKRLSGGINSNVFSCVYAGEPIVLKTYRGTTAQRLRRYEAEAAFLSFAEEVAPQYVPRMLFKDDQHQVIAIEFIRGTCPNPKINQIQDYIHHAINFLRLLNQDPLEAKRRIPFPAKDGFLSLKEHLDDLDKRITDLSSQAHTPVVKDEVINVLGMTRSKLEILKEGVYNDIALSRIPDSIETQDLRLSPSDFGFHNSIIQENAIKFFDFEYSGRDDPAKTIIDFDLQPSHQFLNGRGMLLRAYEPWTGANENRYNALSGILRLKWVLIVLGSLVKYQNDVDSSAHESNVNVDFFLEKINLARKYL